jgi:hypothetical protein
MSAPECRGRARASQGHDAANLSESETDATGLFDERDDAQDVGRVAAIACRGPARRRQDASRFIQPECLAAETTPGRHLPDQEPVVHESRIGLAPRGKVKG